MSYFRSRIQSSSYLSHVRPSPTFIIYRVYATLNLGVPILLVQLYASTKLSGPRYFYKTWFLSLANEDEIPKVGEMMLVFVVLTP